MKNLARFLSSMFVGITALGVAGCGANDGLFSEGEESLIFSSEIKANEFVTLGKDTFFKSIKGQSNELKSGTQKCTLYKGNRYSVTGAVEEAGDHIKVTLAKPIAGCSFKVGYVFKEHVGYRSGGGVTPLGTGKRLEVPYRNQLDNSQQPRATCQNTALAMALSYVTSKAIDPDSIFSSHGKLKDGGSMRAYAVSRGAGRSVSHGGNGASVSQIKSYIDSGRPFVLNGHWTSSGHVVLIVGYVDDSFIIHDPYGKFNPSRRSYEATGGASGKFRTLKISAVDRESLCGAGTYCGAAIGR